ncbi:MAG: hypothetical protein Q7T57_02825 [Dehalococcoidales bacterium]|nr:hypothetical protein [Dehalococcoidales bacterium]
MGEKAKEALRVQFDKRLRLEFQGARITSDAGLLACRELFPKFHVRGFEPSYTQGDRTSLNSRQLLSHFPIYHVSWKVRLCPVSTKRVAFWSTFGDSGRKRFLYSPAALYSWFRRGWSDWEPYIKTRKMTRHTISV